MCRLARDAARSYTRPVDIKKLGFIKAHVAAGARVLELGCGQGLILDHLRGHEAVGVEISAEEAAEARRKGHDARVGHAGQYDVGGLFDVVIASEVIEHMLDPQSLIDNAARHLHPGGMLILTTPNGFGFYELSHRHLNPRARLARSRLARRLLGMPLYQRGDGPDHCQWFTQGRVLGMARRGGFALVARRNSDFVTGGERDLRVADVLPPWLASGWYFAFRLEEPSTNRV